MNPHTVLAHLKALRLNAVQILLFTLFLAVCGVGFVSSTAQSSQDDPNASASEEREFKNTIPEHVPVKVKLKNEQAFKKVDNKNWARDFEIEIKNTSSKPIYFLVMNVHMSDILIAGNPLIFQVRYGRLELVHLETPLQPEDVPVLPGESITIKISEGYVQGYEQNRDAENRPDPKKIALKLQRINFGDGTGIHGSQGSPDSIRRQSQNAPPPKREPSACPPARAVREAELFGKFLKSFYSPSSRA
jgi:hypothetical protein